MGEISKATRVVQMAHPRAKAAYERAKQSLAHIPLGQEKLDPRTVKKRSEGAKGEGLDSTLSRMLYQMRNTAQEE